VGYGFGPSAQDAAQQAEKLVADIESGDLPAPC
jgi:hypothetical protein